MEVKGRISISENIITKGTKKESSFIWDSSKILKKLGWLEIRKEESFEK